MSMAERMRPKVSGLEVDALTEVLADVPGPGQGRHFTVDAEPFDLLGRNSLPTPQELLLSALNACLAVGDVTAASPGGIALEKLEIGTAAMLDLRGFLCVDPAVPPGYERIRYVARIKGRGALAELEAIHLAVARMSPKYIHLARPVAIEVQLVTECSTRPEGRMR